MKNTLSYEFIIWLGIFAVVWLYIIPANTESLIKLIAAYVVYQIFREIFAANVAAGQKAEERYQSLMSRLGWAAGRTTKGQSNDNNRKNEEAAED